LADKFSLRKGQSIAACKDSLHIRLCHGREGRFEFVTGARLELLDFQPQLVGSRFGQVHVEMRDLREGIDQLCDARQARHGLFEKLQSLPNQLGREKR
jgi:hypothetical protein